ncbi:MAG: hypothetical protein ABIS68_03505 [Casimicrobiaceae bacterium]
MAFARPSHLSRVALVCSAFVMLSAVFARAETGPASFATSTQAAATSEVLDVDANGTVDALTDGLLVIRYMLGVRGPALIQNAVGSNAMRSSSMAIEDYLATLISANGAPGTPSGCSIAQTPNSNVTPVSPGTTVNLALSCSAGNPLTTCAWNNGIASTSCSVNVTAGSSDTVYAGTASNASGPSSPVNTTVHVSTAQNFCVLGDMQINVTWPAGGQALYSTNGLKNERVTFKITVPYTFSPPLNISHLGYVRLVERPGATVIARDMTVSKNACDFQSGQYLYNAIGYGDSAPGANYTVNNAGGNVPGANFNVNSGDVFYVNMRNANNGVPNCPAGPTSCDVYLDFATPNRY